MKPARIGQLCVLFTTLALAGCKYQLGTGVGELAEDLTCHSDVLNQTITLEQGEILMTYRTNMGEDFYGLTRRSTETISDKAFTTKIETETVIKMYDHDRWLCRNQAGTATDYKTLQPL